MKVVITEDFKQKYTDLFDEMQQLLGTNSGLPAVESLATYFTALDHFRKEGQILANKFYRLPLEEPTFKVDMDTRMIEVPTLFKNNGLGVKGDTNAEIIFFEMQRWYDTMDLAAQQCFVQWTNSSNKIEANKKGNSPVILFNEVDDVLTFGWVITNNMTEQSGNLEFALRFFTLNEDQTQLNYSVSTQKASCAIKPALDLEVIGVEADTELENLILTRPVYSGIINSMNGAAPTIKVNLLENLGDLAVNGEAELSKEDENYTDYEDVAPAGILRLKVDAISPDGGQIVYRWYNGKTQLSDLLTGKVDEDSEYVANIAGTYVAQVGNYKQGTGTRWIYSDTVVVPHAAELDYGDVSLFPVRNYSTGEEDSALIFDVVGYNKPEDVKYVWTVTDLEDPKIVTTVTEGVNGNTYIPPLNLEGKVSCTAVNHRNNTQSQPLSVKPTQICELRAQPDTPSSVTVAWDSSEGKVWADVKFEEGSPSAKWEKEWQVTWTREINVNGQQSSTTLNEKGLQFNPSLIAPSAAGQVNTYVYSCNVAHTVFAGSAMAQTSAAQYSNKLILEVAYGGAVTARVQ